MNRLVAVALWASCGCAIGAEAIVEPVHLFLAGPGDDGVLARDSRHPAGVREYDVVPNVVGLAENALRDFPSAVLVAHDESGELLELHQRRFEPVEGFIIDRQGNVVIDADVGLEGLSFFWTGAGPHGSASISVRRGRISARILVDNTTYMAVTGPERQSVLQELAGSRLGREMNYAPSVESTGTDIDAIPPVAKYIDHVRVLVVHTAQAEAQAILEGTTIADLANAAVLLANEALIESEVIQLQILNAGGVGTPTFQVAYDESPGIADIEQRWYTHRAWVRSSAEVDQLRNAHDADLVVLLVQQSQGGISGIAYVHRPDCSIDPFHGTDDSVASLCQGVGVAFAPFGFSVVRVTEATSKLSFPHEVGHGFGMEHDPEASSPNPALASFPWSFAHSVVSNLTGEIDIGRRTILSIGCYSPPISDDDCPREPLYSNPDVPFQRIAQPSGTTAPDNSGRSRFNAKTGALIAPYVAAFRGPDAVSQRIFRNGLEKLSDALP